MAGFDFGAFAGGLSRGIQQGHELQLKAEEHKLKAKMLEHDLKKREFESQKWQQELADQERRRVATDTLAGMMERGIATQERQPQVQTEPGDVPMGLQADIPAGGYRPATEQELRAQAIRATPGAQMHQITERLFPSGQTSRADRPLVTSPGQIVIGPTGNVIYTNPNQREGVGVQSQVWSRIVKENPGAPLATLTQKYTDEMTKYGYGTAAARGAGSVSGGAAATLDQSIPPMPQFQGQPIGQRSIHDMTIRELMELGGGGQGGRVQTPPPTTPPTTPPTATPAKPLPLRAKEAEAAAGATGRRAIEAKDKLKDIASTEEIINDLEVLSSRVNKASAKDLPGSRFVQGAQKKLGGWLQTDTDAADLENLRNSFSLAIARSVLSERGVLTDQDREYATNAFPGVTTTRELADRGIFRLRKLTALQRAAEEAMARGENFDVNAFRAEWRKAARAELQPAKLIPRKPGG